MSEFKNHVCWDTERVNSTFAVDVGNIDSELFLATHHPLKVRKAPVGGGGSEWVAEESIANDFREKVPGDRYKLVPIVGDVGTGKTHLVRWVYEETKDTAGWHVVYLKRGNVRLRSVIEELSRGIEEGEFVDSIREKLEGSSDVTKNDAWYRTELINRIASLVVFGDLATDTKQERKGREYVTNVLHDPETRKQMTDPGGIIDRIAKQALGKMGGGEKNFAEKVEILAADLPIDATGAGKHATDALSAWAGSKAARSAATGLMNNVLSDAIRGVFAGDVPLQELMETLRKELKNRGEELVIFIEEMVVLTGIEQSFIEAITMAGDESFCDLRVMFACTPDRFNGMETIKDRLADSYYLDPSYGDAVFEKEEVVNFISRYLNVARNKESNNYIDNCERCSFKTSCHESFGSANPDSENGDRYGLYPFTQGAIERFVQKSSNEQYGDNKIVTPRQLVKDLKAFLFLAEKDLNEGVFISAEDANRFFEEYKTHSWGAALGNAVRREYPGLGGTIVRYWTPVNSPAKLEGEELVVTLGGGAGIFEAFGMTAGTVVEPATGSNCACGCGCFGGRLCNCGKTGCRGAGETGGCDCGAGDDIDPPVITDWTDLLSSTDRGLVEAIDEWAGGKELSVGRTGEVRQLIRDVVLNNLDACRVPLQQSFIKKKLEVAAQLKKYIALENALGGEGSSAILMVSSQRFGHALIGIIRISKLNEEEDEFPGRDASRRSAALAIREWGEVFSKHFDNDRHGDIDKELDTLLIRTLACIGEQILEGAQGVQQNLFEPLRSEEIDLRTEKWRKLILGLARESTKHEEYEKAVTDAVGETRGPKGSVKVINGRRLGEAVAQRLDFESGCFVEAFLDENLSGKFVTGVNKEWEHLCSSAQFYEDIDFGEDWDGQIKIIQDVFHSAVVEGVMPKVHSEVKEEIELLSRQMESDSHKNLGSLRRFIDGKDEFTLFDKIRSVTSEGSLHILEVSRLTELMKRVLNGLAEELQKLPDGDVGEERVVLRTNFLEELQNFKQAIQEIKI